MSIPELIQIMAKDRFNRLTLCTVIDSPTNGTITCRPIDGTADILEVRLQATSGSGVLCVPTVGSVVLVGLVNETLGCVVLTSDIDSFQFFDGSFGGLIKIEDLVNKLNALEEKVNDLVTWSGTHTHSGVSTGGGVSGPATGVSGTLTPTQREDLENGLITHGV